MGAIKKILATARLEPRTITAQGLWTDLCENVHLHYRNIRLDLSEDEWARVRSAVNGCGIQMEHAAQEKDYREGNPEFLMQFIFSYGARSNSDYYPDRFLVELQRDNTVHVHYRDLRLHLTIPEFDKIARAFDDARAEMGIAREFPYSHVEEATRVWVDIHAIQPYDAGHRAMAIDQEHRDGIDYVKGLMSKNGNVMRPILVDTEGQRLDGFKRYMAALELGRKQIECIVDPFGAMGGQHNQSLLDDD